MQRTPQPEVAKEGYHLCGSASPGKVCAKPVGMVGIPWWPGCTWFWTHRDAQALLFLITVHH